MKMKIQLTKTRAVLRSELIAINTYVKRELPQINNLTLHLKELEKEVQTKTKASIKKEIIKTRAERNEINRKTINKTES